MNHPELYKFLARCLALDFVEENRQYVANALLKKKLNIEDFVRMADNHLVLQSVYPKLQKYNLINHIPDELAEFLLEVYNLNSERNKRILKQIEVINSYLKSENITPLYLKGSGNIIDALYADPAERILHDIDFLVEEKDFIRTAEILMANGYKSDHPVRLDDSKIDKHFPVLYSENYPSYVEIHKKAVRKAYSEIFSPESIFADKKKPAGTSDCFVMSDEHKLIHNFIHSQLEQSGHYYALSSLRDLYDALLLSQRTNPAEVFSGFGHYRKKTGSYLEIIRKSFGIQSSAMNTSEKYSRCFLIRHELNLRSALFGQISFVFLRMFVSYIKKPFIAIYDKEMRKSLCEKLSGRQWYRKHFKSYTGRKNINSKT